MERSEELVTNRSGSISKFSLVVVRLLLLVGGCGASQEPPSGGAMSTGGLGVESAGTGGASSTGGGSGGGAQPRVSFARELYPLVAGTCATGGCHDIATTMNHVTDFSTSARTYSRWVNGPGTDFCGPLGFASRTIVVPGQPKESFLIDKISSTRQEPCTANHYPRMPPPPRPSLSAEVIERFTRWIAEGAADN